MTTHSVWVFGRPQIHAPVAVSDVTVSFTAMQCELAE